MVAGYRAKVDVVTGALRANYLGSDGCGLENFIKSVEDGCGKPAKEVGDGIYDLAFRSLLEEILLRESVDKVVSALFCVEVYLRHFRS
jgi:hypothetical protein